MKPITDTSEEAPGTRAIRILAFNVGDAVYEMLAKLIQAQSDMVLLGSVQDRVELLLACAEGADVLLYGASTARPLPGICTHLLNEFPYLKVLVLAPEPGEAELYWLGLRRRKQRYSSEHALLAEIRKAHLINPTA